MSDLFSQYTLLPDQRLGEDYSLNIFINTQNTSGAIVNPDSAPTFKLFDFVNIGSSPWLTGTLTPVDTGNNRGFYRTNISLDPDVNSFINNTNYLVKINTVVAGSTGTKLFEFRTASATTEGYLNQILYKIGTPEITLAEDISNVAADIFTINPDDYDTGNNFAARTLAIQNTGVQILIDTNELQTNFANGGTLEIRIDGLESGISGIKTKTDYLPSITPGQAGGLFIAGTNSTTTVNFTGNLSGSVGSVSSLGNGSSLSGIPWNSAWDVEVQSEVTDALNAYDPPTKTELDASVDNLLKENIPYTLTTENGAITTTFVVD